MTVLSVARKDFKAVRRSRALWGVATALALLFAVIAYSYEGYQLTPAEAVQAVFGLLAMVLAVLLPIVALVGSYMAIAGERESGGIKFLLSFPNTRRDVFLGKLASRLGTVGAGVVFLFGAAASVAVSKHGVFPPLSVLGLFVLSLVYGSVFVGIAVALSGAVAGRSRAIAAAIGAYFGLVILYVVPFFRISTIVRWLHTTILGFGPNPHLYGAVTYLSPYIVFRKATNLVFPPGQEFQIFGRGATGGSDLPLYLSDEFALVVFAAWLVLPSLVGYLRFKGADLE